MTVGEVARRAGVSTSTLRAWERRYGLLQPARSEGGHRRYRLADLQRVTRTLELLRQGWSTRAAADHVLASSATPLTGHVVPDPAGGTFPGVSDAASGAHPGAGTTPLPGGTTPRGTTPGAAAPSTPGSMTTVATESPPEPEVDPVATAAAYRAARRLLALEAPAEASTVLIELVEELGGHAVEAGEAPPDAIPVDLAFGTTAPLLPVADDPVARMRLEFTLPGLVEDARRMVDLLRATSR